MAVTLSDYVKELLRSRDTKKVLATVDKNGVPNVAFKGSITADEEGNILVLELLETSQTNKNLTYSLWFDKIVTVSVLGENGVSYQIKGVPKKVHIDGPYFEQKYKEVKARNPQSDLSGVWIIEPTEVKEQTYSVRLQEQKEQHPIIGHLDADRNEQYEVNK